MEKIEDRISTILSAQFRVAKDRINSNTTLGELSFDSLVLIELGLALDKEFDIDIPDGQLTEDLTIPQIVEIVTGREEKRV